MLSPPSDRKWERILLYGGPDAGKTTAIVNIAEVITFTGGDSHIWHVDTDNAWMANDPGGLDGTVTVFDVNDYAEWLSALSEIRGKAKPGDWLTIDMVDKAWDMSQEEFWAKLTGRTVGDVFMAAKRDEINMAGSHGSNWTVINKMYRDISNQLQRWRGHVLACTPQTDVREPDRQGKGGDSPDVRDTFGRVGVRPQGQKHLPHLFHSVILLQHNPRGWTATTIKERWRGRERMKGEGLGDGFALGYLVKYAGWTI